MDIIYENVAGFDVHQKNIVVAVRLKRPHGQVHEEVRTFGTMTKDILELADWLTQLGVTHAAMESTGVLWKPIWNILEDCLTLLLVNPYEIKQVPGRKSDVRDCQWIAQLLQCGLLRNSFVPPRPQRELRDLTRQRAQLVAEHTRVANRVHKVLEDANIKLGAVVADVLGKSGRSMLQAIVHEEQDPVKLAELAQSRLRGKIPLLREALRGHVTEHHRFLLESLLGHLEYLEREIGRFDDRIEECLRPFVDAEQFERLDVVPGVNRRTIENVIAEIGVNMSRFADEDHLSSWAGVCPGNEESAGRRKRCRTTHGNRWLRRALAEAAWAASRTKGTYLSAQYRRLAGRRGKKRALMAVAHSLLVIFYHLLKSPVKYQDLGADYFARQNPERLRRNLVKRLESLGYEVNLSQREMLPEVRPENNLVC